VHAEYEYIGVVAKYGGITVTLVYIQINNRGAVYHAALYKMQYHNGKIIEYTEPFAVIAEGVVCAAGKITAYAALNGAPRRAKRSPNRSQ